MNRLATGARGGRGPGRGAGSAGRGNTLSRPAVSSSTQQSFEPREPLRMSEHQLSSLDSHGEKADQGMSMDTSPRSSSDPPATPHTETPVSPTSSGDAGSPSSIYASGACSSIETVNRFPQSVLENSRHDKKSLIGDTEPVEESTPHENRIKQAGNGRPSSPPAAEATRLESINQNPAEPAAAAAASATSDQTQQEQPKKSSWFSWGRTSTTDAKPAAPAHTPSSSSAASTSLQHPHDRAPVDSSAQAVTPVSERRKNYMGSGAVCSPASVGSGRLSVSSTAAFVGGSPPSSHVSPYAGKDWQCPRNTPTLCQALAVRPFSNH